MLAGVSCRLLDSLWLGWDAAEQLPASVFKKARGASDCDIWSQTEPGKDILICGSSSQLWATAVACVRPLCVCTVQRPALNDYSLRNKMSMASCWKIFTVCHKHLFLFHLTLNQAWSRFSQQFHKLTSCCVSDNSLQYDYCMGKDLLILTEMNLKDNKIGTFNLQCKHTKWSNKTIPACLYGWEH